MNDGIQIFRFDFRSATLELVESLVHLGVNKFQALIRAGQTTHLFTPSCTRHIDISIGLQIGQQTRCF